MRSKEEIEQLDRIEILNEVTGVKKVIHIPLKLSGMFEILYNRWRRYITPYGGRGSGKSRTTGLILAVSSNSFVSVTSC